MDNGNRGNRGNGGAGRGPKPPFKKDFKAGPAQGRSDRPRPAGESRPPRFGEGRKFDRPAGNGDGRKFDRPAGSGEGRKFDRPARPDNGRPGQFDNRSDRPRPAGNGGGRSFDRPARPDNGRPGQFDNRSDRPRPAGNGGERRFDRPARPDNGRPGQFDNRSDRPRPAGNGGERSFDRPARSGESRAYGKPFERDRSRRFVRPAERPVAPVFDGAEAERPVAPAFYEAQRPTPVFDPAPPVEVTAAAHSEPPAYEPPEDNPAFNPMGNLYDRPTVSDAGDEISAREPEADAADRYFAENPLEPGKGGSERMAEPPRGQRADRPLRMPAGRLGKPPFERTRPGRGSARGDGPKPVIADARRIALYALSDVNRAGAYSQLALDKHLRASGISVDDKRLATQIFYAALENKILLTYILAQFVEKMPEPVVEDILHVAAAQLLFLDRVPDHAATDEAVKQVKALGREHFAPLVNGALRSLIRARDAGEIKYPAREDGEAAYLCVMHSLPEALAKRLIADYGAEEAEKMIAYRPDAHRQTVRPNLLKMDGPAFEMYMDGRGWQYEKGVVENAYRVTGLNDLAGDPGFRDGLFSVQGEGSMLAALALGARRGENVLDACAAPGGKASLLCEKMGDTGRVQCWEIHDHRAELLRAVKKRLRLDSLRVLVRDASVFRPECECEFDGVLIDAPCSGLGVMISKPDIKYRVTEEDLTALAQTQKKILHACAPYVKVGGLLVYSTCTVLKDENARQVEAFLAKHGEYELLADDGWLPDAFKPAFQNGMLQLQPYRDGVEGFFVARMRRTSL